MGLTICDIILSQIVCPLWCCHLYSGMFLFYLDINSNKFSPGFTAAFGGFEMGTPCAVAAGQINMV